MATVNLGRIKPVFRGAYSGSTAYVVDDIVTHGNESFICIQAHGAGTQATSQTSYWTKLAAKGTDGTDVGTTITTQGDILYRDGSGLQRLAKGTAAQVLKMNTAANAPEWGNLSSDFVKIDSGSFSSVGSVDLDGTAKWGTSGTYARHFMVFYNMVFSESTDIYGRQIDSGTVNTGGSVYSSAVSQRNSGNTSNSAGAVDAGSAMKFTHDQLRGANNGANTHSMEFTIGGMHKVGSSGSSDQLQIIYHSTGSNQDGNGRLILHQAGAMTPGSDGSNTTRTGLRIYWNNGTASGNYVIYGMKV
tara:strand:+ start:939 stop:1844 length:906 start_codon:yes stop_codon:yes gene_type:complete